MSNKQQLQTNNDKLDALIARVTAAKNTAASLPEAGGGEDVTTETNEYTSLNTELEEVINSLPEAGGSSVETVSVTLTETGNGNSVVAYFTTMNGFEMQYIQGSSITKDCIKNSIIVLCWSSYEGVTDPFSDSFYQNLDKVYNILGVDNTVMFTANANGTVSIFAGAPGGGGG